MLISHKNKFLYISPVKCASTTIRMILKPHSDICSFDYNKSKEDTLYKDHHANARSLKKHFDEQEWDWDTYFKFTFARNPWSRNVSRFCYNIKMGFTPKDQSFKKFIIWDTTGPKAKDVSISSFIADDDGNNMMDYVGKIENMSADIDYVCDEIGIKPPKVEHTNTTKHKHYTEYYDEETKQLVADKYAKDIEYFGYEFGE